MARCDSCDYPIPDDRDRAGARCTSCHAPLYEPPTRVARPAKPDEPVCARHVGLESVGMCARCKQHLCETCRTRWRTQILCAGCVERAFSGGEASPAEAQASSRQSLAAACFAGGAWAGGALAAALMSRAPAAGESAPIFLLASIVLMGLFALPAAVAMGQAAAALRGRTEQPALATAGFVLGGLYVAALIGMGGLALWQG